MGEIEDITTLIEAELKKQEEGIVANTDTESEETVIKKLTEEAKYQLKKSKKLKEICPECGSDVVWSKGSFRCTADEDDCGWTGTVPEKVLEKKK